MCWCPGSGPEPAGSDHVPGLHMLLLQEKRGRRQKTWYLLCHLGRCRLWSRHMVSRILLNLPLRWARFSELMGKQPSYNISNKLTSIQSSLDTSGCIDPEPRCQTPLYVIFHILAQWQKQMRINGFSRGPHSIWAQTYLDLWHLSKCWTNFVSSRCLCQTTVVAHKAHIIEAKCLSVMMSSEVLSKDAMISNLSSELPSLTVEAGANGHIQLT